MISNISNRFSDPISDDSTFTNSTIEHSSTINLPSGGGAIKGISETFAANPITGTASLSIPLPVATARSFSPKLSLQYDSGAGNGPFGLGWHVAIPTISRKSSQQLPLYQDSEESDIFSFSGVEDLVPLLTHHNDEWHFHIQTKVENGSTYEIKRYRPRTEGNFSLIERWHNLESGANNVHWRVWSRNNVLSVFGETAASQIYNPDRSEQIFSWLLSYTQDDKGNRIEYIYKREDLIDVEFKQTFEQHRFQRSQANLYPKRILYGNRVPYWQKSLDESDYLFQTVFDYGEHDELLPQTMESRSWPVRHDPYSSYRSRFEIRTYRRCQRVLLFHNFSELHDEPSLVRSLDLSYEEEPGFSFLSKIAQRGYQRIEQGYESEALPPIEFEYQQHDWQSDIVTIESDDLTNVPAGVDGGQYRWLDLYGEGLPGILAATSKQVTYKRNKGEGHFDTAVSLPTNPSLSGIQDGSLQIRSLAADGQLSLVAETNSVKGYHKLRADEEWDAFSTFRSFPNIDLRHPNLRRIDLTGNGQPDLLITEETVLHWYPADGLLGYKDAEQSLPFATDEHDGPALIFADEAESIFLADMSGDGLQDVVRIRNGKIVYWPNLGYGRFGSQLIMGQGPRFDAVDQFNPNRIRLADLDGSGTVDLIYLGNKEICYWLNLSGNQWSQKQTLPNRFPGLDNYATISVFDLLGTGTSCLVWSSTLPAHANHPIRYIDLMGSTKPHLLVGYTNNMGKKVSFSYTPSTQFYLEDKANGTPWVTKLHFPVHCLAKVETVDEITNTRFVSEYSYHHGYYDRKEREFRGFGRVDQLDTESFENFSGKDSANVTERPLYQPPVLTKTWFHTGAPDENGKILSQYRHEYFQHQDYLDTPLPEPQYPSDLNTAEWYEALRACRGVALRGEVYSLDGTTFDEFPYSIAESNCQIMKLQPKERNRHAVFQRVPSEAISVQLDRQPADPRVTHNLTLELNHYGQPLKTATINYPRRIPGPIAVQDQQARFTISVSLITYTDEINNDATYRLPQVCESQNWELGYPSFQANDSPWALFTPQTVLGLYHAAQEVEYEVQQNNSGEKRLLRHSRTYFTKDDLSGPLPLRVLGGLAIPYQTQMLAFTPALLESIYEGRVSVTMLEEAGYVHGRDSTFQNGRWVAASEDNNWWVPSETAVFDTNPAEMFYLPIGSRDPFGNENLVSYDPYFLQVESVTDALGNQTRVINDYQLLQPVAIQDPNGNWSVVENDLLGRVVKMATLGKLPPEENPLTATVSEGDTLQNPSVEFEYDLNRWRNQGRPNVVKTIAWEEHIAANPNRIKTQIKYEYSDGGGQVIMVKAQAEPGLARQQQPDGTVVEVDTTPNLRWIGNGRTIFNNKGNPVKQYEPYYSVTPEYEDAAELVEVGVTPIIFYDAPGRQLCRLLPNHSFEKSVLSPWRSESWDVNDSMLISNPALDPDVGAYFDDLDTAVYLPSWTDARMGGDLGLESQRTAQRLVDLGHPNTPTITLTDALGRTLYTESNNGSEGVYMTQTTLDIEGSTLAVIDGRGNTVMRYEYNLLPPPDKNSTKLALVVESMDSGKKISFLNAAGNMLHSWDSRGHEFRLEYDALQRPTQSFVTENGDEKLIGWSIYGEAAPDPKENNLIGQVWQAYDQAGFMESSLFDFKGNPLVTRRTLAEAYDETIDWQVDLTAQLQAETFTAVNEYDGLNRVTRALSPHHATLLASEIRPYYGESGGLARVNAAVRGGALTTIVNKIEYDAKGQRQSIRYGNGVTTTYTYDPETYRLTRLHSERSSDGALLQDLNYTYDPIGNITEIRDDAQQTVFFSNQMIEPHNIYQYDPLYRLIEANGREHALQAKDLTHIQGWHHQNHPNSGQHMRRYTQTYGYDSVGNITQMRHSAAGDNWTRSYTYASDSNRLLSTQIGNETENYSTNAHGSITSMNHLSEMAWDFAEQLREVTLDQAGGRATYIYDSSGQRVRKIHQHSGNIVEERIYFGGWEIYRKHINGSLNLERETLHVMDDQRRIALIETKTVENSVPITNPLSFARYQMSNHLGSAALELNETGEIISYEEFHPYGTTAYHAGTNLLATSPKRYRYTGKERDEETGFAYHSLRYLCLTIARWTTVDPSGLSDGLNVYQYVHGNPISFEDSTGLGGTRVEPFLTDDTSQHTAVYNAFDDLRQNPNSYFATASDEELNLWADVFLDQANPDAWYTLIEHLGSSSNVFKGSHLMRLGMARIGAMQAEYGEGNYFAAGANAVIGGIEGAGTAYFGDTVSETIKKFTINLALNFAGYKLFQGIGAAATWGSSFVRSYADEIALGFSKYINSLKTTASASRYSGYVRSSSEEGQRLATELVEALRGKTAKADEIADAIESGSLEIRFYLDASFNKLAKKHLGLGDENAWNVYALNRENVLYLRALSGEIAEDAVHEGTHALDYLAGMQGPVLYWEARAMYSQYFFGRVTGKYGNWDFIKFHWDLLTKYKWFEWR